MRNIILAAFLGALSASAQNVQVAGRVLTASGEPVAAASVFLRPLGQAPVAPGQDNRIRAATDAQGQFALEAAPGRYVLSSEKATYLPQQFGMVTLEPEKPLGGLTIRMTLAASITGRVTDAAGDPVVNAQVTAFVYTYIRGARQMTAPGYSARTDDRGVYRLPNLAAGRYFVRADTIYYPSATGSASAVAIDIAAGEQHTGADISHRRQQTFSIRGKAIEAATGAPAINAALRILQEGEPETLTPPLPVPTRAPDGAFEFTGLAPGIYTIRAAPSGFVMTANGERVPARYAGRLQVSITNGDVDDVSFAVNAGAELTGSIAMENGGPLPEAPRPALPPDLAPTARAGWQAALTAAEQTFTWGDLSGIAGPDGSFRIERILPGRYYPSIRMLPPAVYIKSIHLGPVDVTREPLTIAAGSAGPLRIVLASNPGEVRGVVRNREGQPVARVTVSLWPEQPDRGTSSSGVRAVTTGEDGRFQVLGLRPEKYYAAAFEEAEPAYLRSPDFLDRFRSRGAAVDVAPGSTSELVIEPVSRADAAAEIRRLP